MRQEFFRFNFLTMICAYSFKLCLKIAFKVNESLVAFISGMYEHIVLSRIRLRFVVSSCYAESVANRALQPIRQVTLFLVVLRYV